MIFTKIKRTLAVATAIAMIFTLTASFCYAEEADSDAGERLQYLADEGVISQDTLDAIVAYLDANGISLTDGMGGDMPEKPDGEPNGDAPQKPDGEPNGEAPQKPDGEPGGDAPEKPDGEPNGEAPEKPSGEPNGDAPEKRDGEPGGDMPQMPGAFISEDILSELLENNVITQSDYDAISEYQESQRGDMGMGGGPNGGAQNVSYKGAAEITEECETDGETYASETSDENAVLINTADSVTLTDATVTKTGDSDGGDSCSFYGVNAGVLAMGGADVTISGGSVTTDANGAKGVFSYGGNGGQNGAEGDGTSVTISDTVITTTGDNAGGIMTTGGGATNASNLMISTSGRSSAAIRTDRGGGTVNVDGGSYTTSGLGSPAIYSTADITVSNAELVSELSEGVCIEGKNSITLNDCDLTANNTQCNGNATFFDSINIYQSMSGDADSGTSSFTMNGGRLESKSGHVFHVTNTNAVITLSDAEIVNDDEENVLLSVCDDGWSGAENRAELVCDAQTISGNILVGSNSYLSMTLKNGSAFTGAFSGSIRNSLGESVNEELGEVSVTLEDDSTWTLTADTYISSFTGSADQIISNGYTLYVNGEAIN